MWISLYKVKANSNIRCGEAELLEWAAACIKKWTFSGLKLNLHVSAKSLEENIYVHINLFILRKPRWFYLPNKIYILPNRFSKMTESVSVAHFKIAAMRLSCFELRFEDCMSILQLQVTPLLKQFLKVCYETLSSKC